MIIFARVAHTRYLFKIVFQGLAGFFPAFSFMPILPILLPRHGIFIIQVGKLYIGEKKVQSNK